MTVVSKSMWTLQVVDTCTKTCLEAALVYKMADLPSESRADSIVSTSHLVPPRNWIKSKETFPHNKCNVVESSVSLNQAVKVLWVEWWRAASRRKDM